MKMHLVVPAEAGTQSFQGTDALDPHVRIRSSRGDDASGHQRGDDASRHLRGNGVPVRAFIFDMDGTMVDSMSYHARSWAEFTRRHAIAMEVDEILRRTTGRNGVECIRELFGPQVEEARALELIAEKEAVYRELFAPSFREVAGFRAFAHGAAQRGLKLAVATAGDKHNIAFVLERLKLALPPHAIVGGDEGLPGKPEPALFLEAARRLGMLPAQCIVFEDAPFGIEAARRAGMRAVAICTSHSAEELAGPHVVAQVRDYHELTTKNFLENLNA